MKKLNKVNTESSDVAFIESLKAKIAQNMGVPAHLLESREPPPHHNPDSAFYKAIRTAQKKKTKETT